MKGQILLITVFGLTLALFSIYFIMAPIKDKVLRIKDMERVYQAIANAEIGLESSLLDVFKGINLDLDKNVSSFQTQNCAGLTFDSSTGNCLQTTYTPKSSWNPEYEFSANNFLFQVVINGEIREKMKTISDGFSGKVIRTAIIGSLK